MATSKAQLEQQILGLSEEVPASSGPQVLEVNPTTPPAAPMSVQDQLAELERLIQESSSAKKNDPIIEIPDFDESFEKYQKRLRGLYGQTSRPSLYDLASTVGGAMLSADPTMGAFRSAGLGMAQFGKEQAALKQRRAEEDRAIGLKAFELAKTDVDAATKMVREYDFLRAKEDPDNKVTEVQVTDPNGLIVAGVRYEEGDRALLTEKEIFRNRNRVANVAKPISGIKVPDAGAIAVYQSRPDAIRTIKGLGLSEDSPFFSDAVDKLVPDNPSKIGRTVIVDGKYAELRPFVVNGEVQSIMLTADSKDTTPFMDHVTNRLRTIAKNEDTYIDKSVTVLPTVDRALVTLRDLKRRGVETGIVTKELLPFKKVFKQIFGTTDPSLASLDSLIAISNMLAPKMRPVGSGSTSDMEFEAYKTAILSMSNTPEANYIALYFYKKMTENAIARNRAETNALTSGDYTKSEEVSDYLDTLDMGIFYSFKGDANDNDEVQKYLDSVPDGEVVINRDPRGVELVKDAGPYIIQGFGE
jgi:hypothetical protein